jgi:hypothetical protein
MDFSKKENRWLYYIIKYGVISASILVMFTSLKSCYEQRQERKEIINNKAFTKGTIVKIGRMSISGHYLVYTYEVKGKILKNRQPTELLPCATFFDYNNCIGLKYWVIYSKKNPEKSGLLATEFDYEYYNLKVPITIKPLRN